MREREREREKVKKKQIDVKEELSERILIRYLILESSAF